jgi:hypothetical protein
MSWSSLCPAECGVARNNQTERAKESNNFEELHGFASLTLVRFAFIKCNLAFMNRRDNRVNSEFYVNWSLSKMGRRTSAIGTKAPADKIPSTTTRFEGRSESRHLKMIFLAMDYRSTV